MKIYYVEIVVWIAYIAPVIYYVYSCFILLYRFTLLLQFIMIFHASYFILMVALNVYIN